MTVKNVGERPIEVVVRGPVESRFVSIGAQGEIQAERVAWDRDVVLVAREGGVIELRAA